MPPKSDARDQADGQDARQAVTQHAAAGWKGTVPSNAFNVFQCDTILLLLFSLDLFGTVCPVSNLMQPDISTQEGAAAADVGREVEMTTEAPWLL